MKTELKFPSKMENISHVERLIDEISSKHGISSETYGNILVALMEAVNNAILHGNKLDENKTVHLGYTVDNDIIIFTIKDEGEGFDVNTVPDPTLPENIEKPHGRGIFLMKHLVDEIKFERNGAVVELTFKLK